MDLPDVVDLSQLKWWFDRKKINNLPKQQFLDDLYNMMPAIPNEVRERLINKFAPKNNQTLNGLMGELNDKFNNIFNIK
jgi:hypothetical protein